MNKEEIIEILKNLSDEEMQIVREHVVNRFSDIIPEMAFDRKTVIKKIEGLERPINLHLIKVIRYKDELNFEKHLKDIKKWIEEIQELDVGKKDKKLPEREYFKLLFTSRFSDEHNSKYILKLEKGVLSEYSNLPKLRDEKETISLIYKIEKELAKRLSEDNAYDIISYIKDLLKG